MTQTALTREQVLALKPGNNLDLVVAIEVMGHEAGEFRDDWIKLGPKFEGCPKRYSSDMSTAWRMESSFKQDVKLREAYAIELHNVMGLMLHEPTTLENVYQIAHATPEQRCKAAILAVLRRDHL